MTADMREQDTHDESETYNGVRYDSIHLTDFMQTHTASAAYDSIRDVYEGYANQHLAAWEANDAFSKALNEYEALNKLATDVAGEDYARYLADQEGVDYHPEYRYLIDGQYPEIAVYEMDNRHISYDDDGNLTYTGANVDVVCHVSVDAGIISEGGTIDFKTLNRQLIEAYLDNLPITSHPVGMKEDDPRDTVDDELVRLFRKNADKDINVEKP